MFFRRRNQSPPSAEAIACDLLRRSDLFDPVWYLDRYPDVLQAGFDPVLHYVRHGARERRKPGPWFNTERYLESVEAGLEVNNPLLHYLEHRHTSRLTDIAQERAYSNLAEFLRFTVLSPIIHAPFREEDRRCFAVMEAISKNLVRGLKGNESVKVSVIMPVRNRVQTLQAAIDSVIAQKYSNFELIIVDDGSEDESVAVARQASILDSRVRLIELGQHRGVCVARNVGLVNATGAVIAYLDSDNTWLEDYLGAAIGAFHLLPEADAIYSGQYIYGAADVTRVSAVRFAPMNISLLEQHNYIDLNCFLHRRRVIDAGIMFDEDLQRLVDWDFILRISSSYRIVSVPVLLSQYYLHAAENTITNTVPLEPAIEKIVLRGQTVSLTSSETLLSKRVCIVIPSYQALGFLRDCVASLSHYLDSPLVEVVVVDNNSSDDVKEYLRRISSNKIKVIINEVNYGFSYAVNQGAALASPGADILVMNNDARFEGDCLGILQHLAYEDSDIAIAVPRQIVPASADDVNLHVPYASPSMECDVNLSIHHKNIESIGLFHDGQRVELTFAPFFCVYIKRTVWDDCGGLDYENGRHYRSDRIMCDFIKQVLKLRIVYTPVAKVHHAAQASTKELDRVGSNDEDDYRTMLIRNEWPSELKRDLKIKKRPWIDF